MNLSHKYLVIIDDNIWGMKSYDVGCIIEEDKLSTVIFISKQMLLICGL